MIGYQKTPSARAPRSCAHSTSVSTPAVLKEYLASFDPRITALTGPEAEIEAAFSAFNVYWKIVPLDGDDYTVDHSAGVHLYDREGPFAVTLDLHEPQDVRIAKVGRLVSEKNSLPYVAER